MNDQNFDTSGWHCCRLLYEYARYPLLLTKSKNNKAKILARSHRNVIANAHVHRICT